MGRLSRSDTQDKNKLKLKKDGECMQYIKTVKVADKTALP